MVLRATIEWSWHFALLSVSYLEWVDICWHPPRNSSTQHCLHPIIFSILNPSGAPQESSQRNREVLGNTDSHSP